MPNYRLRAAASGTPRAAIRRRPHANARVVRRLEDGEAWQGEAVQGQRLYVRGMGSSDRWVSNAGVFVWLGALELVRGES